MQGTVIAVCTSERKGTQKLPVVGAATLVRGHGLHGDAHAGNWHRQVSLLADEDIQKMRDLGLDLAYGAFGENVVTTGIDLLQLQIGRRVRVGESTVLQVTQHGKKCHTRCEIYKRAGDCIMPRQGIFARVVRGGAVSAGDVIRTDPELDRIRYAIVTLSDRASAGEYEDRAGPEIQRRVEAELPAVRVARRVLADDRDKLAAELVRLADDDVVDLILTTGGTGLSPRDTTPEATRAVIDREIPGIAEAIRAGGMQHTPRAMLSRGVAGLRGTTIIVNLSGSPRAVNEQLDVLLPVLGHAVEMASGVPSDCARSAG
jgi:molybdopterin adenylyltransferase